MICLIFRHDKDRSHICKVKMYNLDKVSKHICNYLLIQNELGEFHNDFIRIIRI